jgi:hypothetical protein
MSSPEAGSSKWLTVPLSSFTKSTGKPQARETLVDLRSEDAIAIMDEEAVRMIAGQRFPELLQPPCRRGMGRNVLVENLARSNLYDVRRPAAMRTGPAVNWLAHPARRPT